MAMYFSLSMHDCWIYNGRSQDIIQYYKPLKWCYIRIFSGSVKFIFCRFTPFFVIFKNLIHSLVLKCIIVHIIWIFDLFSRQNIVQMACWRRVTLRYVLGKDVFLTVLRYRELVDYQNVCFIFFHLLIITFDSFLSVKSWRATRMCVLPRTFYS